ncbi:MAG: single-stranded DNA-binding protein [Candidatus Dependentiae bacterium]|nr:single-stranded DNA-binding protein [Candidatus Dependentiae bacterium]
MASFNRIIMIGNLTRDPEYKQLASGQAVCRMSLATNRQFKNKQSGSMIQEVCYIDVDVWGAQAESCRQYLQKGRPALIEGRLKFDSWEDANGQTRSKHSIVADRVVFLSSGQGADFAADENTVGGESTVSNEMEKDLLSQINQIKGRGKTGYATKDAEEVTAPKSKKKKESHDMMPGGEIDFKDAPPFQDDLPF